MNRIRKRSRYKGMRMTKPRILVVEDEGIVAMEIQNRLASMGFAVVGTASSGEVAIQKAATLQPDLVLMDIRLKGNIDGISAAEQIRSKQQIPIVFLTAYADEYTLQRAKVTEPYAYVLKPFEERELHIAIDVALYRHQTERKIRENERWLATTLNSIGDAVIATDANGVINYMNQAAEALTSWVSAEALGQDAAALFTWLDEKTRSAQESPVTTVLQKGATLNWGHDALFIRKDGRELLVDSQTAPIRNEDGQLLGIVLVLRDVTEQRKIENELLKMQRLESLGMLAGGIAHKFNNLLSVIISNVALVKLRTKREDTIYGKLETLEKTAWRAADVGQQLLTFAKGGAPIRKVVNLAEIITTAADLALKSSSARYNFSMAQDLWPVEADQGQMNQVFTSLFLNADQAMPQGGLIQVCAENVKLDHSAGLPLQSGYYLHIIVQDQGVGIPSHLLPRIFDPYFTTKTNASGLGLAAAYSIITRHDGYITVESQLGSGTTFHVYLPVSSEETAPTNLVSPAVAITMPHKKKILVMDDEELVREGAHSVLEYLGCQAEFARDGGEAIQLYQQAQTIGAPFDAVILDLTVQNGMGGKETIKHLLQLDQRVKAIVSSGYSHDPVMANFRDYGFLGVLAKPYTIEEFRNTLLQLTTDSP